MIDQTLDEENSFKKRLNDTFSSIQGKIIAIPVASMIAIGQMQDKNYYKNISLFVGTTIVAILIYMAIRIQYANLNYIAKEVKGQIAKAKEYPCANSRLTDTYSNISKFILNC